MYNLICALNKKGWLHCCLSYQRRHYLNWLKFSYHTINATSVLMVQSYLCMDILQVTISFVKIILNSVRPSTEEQGRLPATYIFRDITQFPMATKITGMLILRVDSGTLCFANANFIKERYNISAPGIPVNIFLR